MSTLITDGTQADVQAKMSAAGPGDVVTIPAGNFPWESGVVESVAPWVTLKGGGSTTATGGVDQTINGGSSEFSIASIADVRIWTGDKTAFAAAYHTDFYA